MSEVIDEKKRRFLQGATITIGVVTASAIAYPFLRSMFPSRRALSLGGPVRVKIGKMKPGEQLTVIWRGKPIWIVRRTKEMLATLTKNTNLLRDPESRFKQQPMYAKSIGRSINPEFLVVVGICTHLGCVPTYRPDPMSIDKSWDGGFYCSCHGSRFDLSGRVYKSMPATLNLEVPPYYFANADEIVIGESKQGVA